MYDILVKASCVVTLLFIWFNTNSIFYYYNLFTGKTLDVPSHQAFSDFLYDKSIKTVGIKRFLLKLLSCYKCISFWLSLLLTLNTDVFIVYVLSLLVYGVLCKLSE